MALSQRDLSNDTHFTEQTKKNPAKLNLFKDTYNEEVGHMLDSIMNLFLCMLTCISSTSILHNAMLIWQNI